MSKKKLESTKSSQFPNIYRFITEKFKKSNNELKILGLGFGFGVIVILIILSSFDLLNNVREKSSIEGKRASLNSQIDYWKQVVEKQKGYRDGYFMLSVLEYQLKDLNKSEDYLKMVLSIDPNFTPAIDFQKLLNRGM